MKQARNLVLSVSILTAHRLRTGLSILGVVVGVAAMILISSIGDGMNAELREVFRAMGTDLLVVRAGKFHRWGKQEHQISSVTTLTPEDAKAIAHECTDSAAVATAISRPQVLKVGAATTSTKVEALEPAGFTVKGIDAATGRLFNDSETNARRTVVVLGATVAETLFPGQDPVGEMVTIGRLPFQVIGVATSKGSDASGADQDDIAFIPLDTGMRRVFHVTWIEMIYVRVPDTGAMAARSAEIRTLLRARHHLDEGIDDDFDIQNQADLLETELETTNATTRLVTGVGAITLIVAGIGILAVMLMSVRERRWEIGLRRAVGARRRDILIQFLSEAALLSFAGALVGVLTGAALVWLTNHMGWASALFSTDAALVSTGISVAIGLVFGIHPARQAAGLEPITALRTRE
ncbi:MAG: ABC transporter permease [Pseudomonadota bacterium]